MHISIAGRLGSGKSTVCKLLQTEHNFEIYSTGAIQRKIASEMNITTLEMNNLMSEDQKYDKMIDEAVTRISLEQSDRLLVFDSRMAWKFAIESFKVFLTVDPEIAGNRVVNIRQDSVESYSDKEDAKEKLIERAELENKRFKSIYHVDNFDYNNYNLVLDTSFATPEEICEIIYDHYTKYCSNKKEETSILLSPKSLYPLQSLRCINPEKLDSALKSKEYISNPITIASFEGYNYVIDGHHRFLASLMNNEKFIEAKVFDETEYPFFKSTSNLVSEVSSVSISTIYDYEDAGGFRYPSYPKYYKRSRR